MRRGVCLYPRIKCEIVLHGDNVILLCIVMSVIVYLFGIYFHEDEFSQIAKLNYREDFFCCSAIKELQFKKIIKPISIVIISNIYFFKYTNFDLFLLFWNVMEE